jgi:hypothetical protein
MAKNIAVFSGGTGQEGGTGHNTNVYAIFNLIIDRSSRQIPYYDKAALQMKEAVDSQKVN